MNDQGHPAVVFVDDEEAMRRSVKQWLELADHSVTTYPDGESALRGFDPADTDVLIADLKMPGIGGLELLDRVLAADGDLPVILVTAHGDVDAAVAAMKRGAYDFVEKPFEPEQLVERIARAAEKRELVRENRRLREQLSDTQSLESRLIGNSKPIGELRTQIAEIAGTRANVLILGETGTGKEIVARCLHDLGPAAEHPFVPVNCGAIPEHLFESEFFGYEPGAFTGAQGTRVGYLAHAGHGTIFLDEVISLPILQQVKILRVLEEGWIKPLGSNKEIAVHARVLSASNLDPQPEVDAGNFRQDLYFRLNTLILRVPPLRDREDDVCLLFEHFVRAAETKFGREAPDIGTADLAVLREHDWPGNVRELRNVADRFLFSKDGGASRIRRIISGTNGQSADGVPASDGGKLADKVQAFERQSIEAALKRHRGNMADVINELGLPRRTLNDKMTRYGLNRQAYR